MRCLLQGRRGLQLDLSRSPWTVTRTRQASVWPLCRVAFLAAPPGEAFSTKTASDLSLSRAAGPRRSAVTQTSCRPLLHLFLLLRLQTLPADVNAAVSAYQKDEASGSRFSSTTQVRFEMMKTRAGVTKQNPFFTKRLAITCRRASVLHLNALVSWLLLQRRCWSESQQAGRQAKKIPRQLLSHQLSAEILGCTETSLCWGPLKDSRGLSGATSKTTVWKPNLFFYEPLLQNLHPYSLRAQTTSVQTFCKDGQILWGENVWRPGSFEPF